MQVLVFGAGDYGNRYLLQATGTDSNVTVVGFLDNCTKLQGRMLYGSIPCYPPERVASLEYNRIVIANNTSNEMRSDIFMQLTALGVSLNDIEYFPDNIAMEDSYYSRISFFDAFSRYAKKHGIAGNVAECGVHTGETAKYLNRFFKSKKLYLFDTFEGFAQLDIDAERKLGDKAFLNGQFNHTEGWNTSVDLVMSKITYPENVIIKKGRVPESFEGVEDTFCFVHLDLDLHQPSFAAMKFFWSKISTGGVMLLHDYFDPQLPGVKRALNDFENHLACKISKIPLNDYWSIVLIKD